MQRVLIASDHELIARARETAHILYEGKRVAHRSCGIAIAATFGLATPPYQALRRGGITGAGECGAIKAGELVIGELLGDRDPTGAVTQSLRAAMVWYQRVIRGRLQEAGILPTGPAPDIVCNQLTARYEDFAAAERVAMCTSIAAEVAATAAEAMLRHGGSFEIAEILEE